MKTNEYVLAGERYLLDCVFDGLAHSYDVVKGEYVKPYPEVTGYVIKYFCDNYDEIPVKVIKAGNKLVRLQDRTGGFASFENKNTLFAFDTSQILIGLAALYTRTGRRKYRRAAKRAADFLIMLQKENGAIIPTFDRKKEEPVDNENLYSIWNGQWSGLMCKLTEGFQAIYEITRDEKYLIAKAKAADFYEASEYIECSHPLGYWLEGLYEADRREKVDEILNKYVLERIQDNGFISYRGGLDYAYVSGVIQLGIILFKMGYTEEAKKIRDYGRLVQSHDSSGGLFQYADSEGNLDHHVHTEINSWGTKYFCQLERMMEESDV